MSDSKKWTLHWRDGSTNEVQGKNIAEAFTLAGFEAGAVRALDYYSEVREYPKPPRSMDAQYDVQR